jgi:membrane protein DedA with SNARE-associated domain
MSLTALVAAYGYYAVFMGAFIEGETVLILGGIAAHRGYLDLPWVMAAAFAGSWLGDQLYFFLGRRYGQAILRRFPALQAKAYKAQRLVERYHAPLILSVRFLYGLRTVGPMGIGMSTVSAFQFVVLNALGALIWAVAVATAGYAFSNVLEVLMPQVRHYEEYLFISVLAAGAVVWLIGCVVRRHARGES